VPAVFVVMDDLTKLLQRMFGRFVGPKDEPDAAAPAASVTPGEAPAGSQRQPPLAAE
jgi:HAE1 family hydrophobic/amphiphilic exporter-1